MWYSRNKDVLTICVYIQPNAKLTEVAGFFGDALKIRLNTPPIEGRANKALQKFLAKLFEVPPSQVILMRGEKSKRKTVKITGSQVDPEQIAR